MILSCIQTKDNLLGDLHLSANTTNGFSALSLQPLSFFVKSLVNDTQRISHRHWGWPGQHYILEVTLKPRPKILKAEESLGIKPIIKLQQQRSMIRASLRQGLEEGAGKRCLPIIRHKHPVNALQCWVHPLITPSEMSMRSNVGCTRSLLQVKRRPLWCSSINSRSLRNLLKWPINLLERQPFFLSLVD